MYIKKRNFKSRWRWDEDSLYEENEQSERKAKCNDFGETFLHVGK